MQTQIAKLRADKDALVAAVEDYLDEYLADFKAELYKQDSIYWSASFMQHIEQRIAQRSQQVQTRQAYVLVELCETTLF